MPAAPFWVLDVLLLPTCSGATMGVLVQNALVVFNLHFMPDGIRLPGLLIQYWVIGLLIAATSVTGSLLRYPKYTPAVLIWFGVIGILHNQIWPYNKNFGFLWVFAWFLSLQAMMFAFSPDMPWSWYLLLSSIVLGLGIGFRPDQSLTGFILWAVTIIVLRMVLFIIYVLYIVNTDTADFFPFNFFSQKWKMSKQRWFPLNSRPMDSFNATSLCEKCDEVTRNSSLIMGSSSYLTKLVEWHDFWPRSVFKTYFSKLPLEQEIPENGPEDSPVFLESSCHLCCLLWNSMSARRQKQICHSIEDAHIQDLELSKPSDLKAELRVKVWEERPLSPFTYMQLFWGEVAVGARILIHQDELFSTGQLPFIASHACKTANEKKASTTIKSRETNSEHHFEQAKKWLQMCKDGHKLCRGVGNTRRELPARMVFVVGGKDWSPGNAPETLRLVSTSQIEPNHEYLAFSHCWGPTAEMIFKLLASNISTCYEGIDFTGLSKNMQDAITTTISLGFSYIWIDSLCIMQQDDKGEEVGEIAELWKADWKQEARKMGSVYSGAVCTIASTGSSSSTGGCFHSRSTTSLTPCKIGVSSPDELSPRWIYARRDDVFDFERNVDRAPLNTRGWVMQERLLSRRILHFGVDMIYWECCVRSASELCQQGYTYKAFPDDFKDNYIPSEFGDGVSTRGEMQKAEREGRGFKWANLEAVRSRPPPVMTDPDNMYNNTGVWQQKRGFWRNILKSNDVPWADDEKSSLTRAGFRAAFEQLRSEPAQKAANVGRASASQVWYDVVEAYSRGQLTSPADKLIALKGIEEEVSRARNLTYLYGLWREQLSTDLLWFAIEGPGERLQNKEGVPVAPTWSWASISATIALDLLPDTSLVDIKEIASLVEIHDVSPSSNHSGPMNIIMSGPLLSISAPIFDGKSTWTLDIGKTGKISAQFFPDVKEPDVCQMSDLVCMTFLVLNREKRKSFIPSSSEDVQGLLLRLVRLGEGEGAPNLYERLGYFTTSYVEKSQAAREGRRALKSAPITKLCLIGSSNID